MKKIAAILVAGLLGMHTFAQSSHLEQEFVTPPEEVQTSVYWYWMCGNISKEGVIKDLEEMKKVGINRVFIGHNYFEPYEGGKNIPLMSDEWWSIMHTALKKASELDIEVGLFNSPGWTQAGGPWIKPAEAMRYLDSSELKVKGPKKIKVKLEKPSHDFQDVKLLAYPSSESKQTIMNMSNARIAVSPVLDRYEKMFDGDPMSDVRLLQNVDYCIEMETNGQFTARSLTIYPSHSNINATFELQAMKNGDYHTISKFVIDWHRLEIIVGFRPFAPVIMTVDETTARQFRLMVRNSYSEGGIAEVELSSVPKIENYAEKTFAKMYQDPLPQWDYYMWRKQPEVMDATLNIDPEKVLDISEYVTAEGMLNWEVPQGNWTILRTGMTPTGVTNNPAGPDGTGLEVDKMNSEHLAAHFDVFIGKVLKRIPAVDRKTFKVVVQDSYESGGQNFTDNFLQKFRECYGYDPIPFLPAYFGRVVGSQAESDRFLWDMRRLVADRIAYDYVAGLREICHQYGLSTWLENYGHWGFPAEFLMYGGQSDAVAGEYWIPNPYPSWENNLGNIENRAASSCAHIYGKNLVSAESNTCGGPAFSHVPADTKQRMDKYFAEGINNTLLHVYIHQPDTNRYPGTNAWFGMEFNRNNTWFTHIDLFIAYIKRCNYMLRQGLNVADVAYFIGEDVPKMTGIQDPALPKGYQFDYINAEVILRDAEVKDGMIILPHGTSYRVLVLPKIKSMRPELLAKIKRLVKDGAVLLGPSPTCSPSLKNQPEADRQVCSMAAELWNGVDGVYGTSGKYGKGLVFDGVALDKVFSTIGYVADCKCLTSDSILYGHRKKGETDIYFLTNQSGKRQETIMQFRVHDMQPELWNPIDGTVKVLHEFSSNDETTFVPVVLEKHESTFIVFCKKGISRKGAINFPEVKKNKLVTTPWQVCFKSPLAVPEPIVLNQLQDLSTSSIPAIKYFSGNIIYTTTFNIEPARFMSKSDIYLDLGEVCVMAKVWVNDQYVGGAWTTPYKINILPALKAGSNTLRIDVVNTWVNRMIGDSELSQDRLETWVGMNPYTSSSPLPKSGLLGPVTICEVQK